MVFCREVDNYWRRAVDEKPAGLQRALFARLSISDKVFRISLLETEGQTFPHDASAINWVYEDVIRTLEHIASNVVQHVKSLLQMVIIPRFMASCIERGVVFAGCLITSGD